MNKVFDDLTSEEKDLYLEDICYHLDFLIQAIKLKEPKIYSNFSIWQKGLKNGEASAEIVLDDYFDYLKIINEKYNEKLGPINAYTQHAKDSINNLVCDRASYLSPENLYYIEVHNYLNYLLKKQRKEANNYIHLLVDEGMSIKDIYQYIFLVSQYEVGIKWQKGEISYSDEQFCTETTLMIMSGLYPKINKFPRVNKMVVGAAISNENHNFGLRMVCDYFEMAGWDTVIISDSNDMKSLHDSIMRQGADIIALSITLTKLISPTQELIKRIRSNKEHNSVKILVGGYALTLFPDLWREIGADGYGADAEEAVIIADLLANNNYRKAFY